MRTRLLCCFLAGLGPALNGFASPAPGPGPVCQTRAGRVQGTRDSMGMLAFLGLAYAAPPVGTGRFLPPRPPAPWAGVRAAAAFGPRAAQLRGDTPAGAENCLTLNVWTPSVRAARRKPVLVWVHGGSFLRGAGDEFPGPRFARHDSLVVVSLTYRLGSLGFLQLSHLLGPAYRQAGNAGLLDAVAALRWVRAKLVAALLVTPAAAGLFQQVILESGGLQAVRDTAKAAAVTARLLSALQLRPDQADQLLTLPLAALLRAQ